MSEQQLQPSVPAAEALTLTPPEAASAKPTSQAGEAKNEKAKQKAAALAEVFPFSVSVGNVYDGPLDLLLDLIRKQDIDIYDIPIAQITAQYLAYVEHIKTFDLDLASEFIYMASLLIQIKSKMLLPRDPTAPPEEQDPRLELVNRLLEHERYKQAAQMLLQKQQLEDAVLSNPALREFRDAEGTEPELAADVVDLVRTFQQILERAKNRPQISFTEDGVTIAQMIDYVRRRLMVEERPLRLRLLLRPLKTQAALICAFLAILELIRLQAVICRQEAVFGEVVLKKSTGFDKLMENDGAAVRDDWR